MKDILRNLANIHMIEFAKARGIDVSGTRITKNGRGFVYSLVDEITGLTRISVTFHKMSVPTYSVTPTI